MLKPTDPAPGPPDAGSERPVSELVHRLVQDGKAYARAEIAWAKAFASSKARALGFPAALLGAAFLFIQAAVTVVAVATFHALLPLVGTFFAGLLAFLIFAGVGGGLGWLAVQKIRRDL